MHAFSASMSLVPEWYESLLEFSNDINLELKSLYLWYHTKLDIDKMRTGELPEDGIMGRVLGLFIERDTTLVKMSVAVDYTALHDPDLFMIRPVTGITKNGFTLLGFSVFPK